LCYCFFRLGKAALDLPTEERILTGLFLCADQPNEILEALKPEWNEKVSLTLDEKCSMLNALFSTGNVFPWENELSAGIDYKPFSESFFIQPDLFLRLRPGKEKSVKEKLQQAAVEFTIISSTGLSIATSTKIDEIIELDKEAVVQDYSSQRVGELLQLIKPEQPVKVWDCCAASGGKSIMAKDILGAIDLTVSDVRESILINLKKRFAAAIIKNYKSLIVDLTKPVAALEGESFNLIIADVPCSGSGTWSRTPEQLYYFKKEQIEQYALLQRKIITTAIPHLASGGHLLYITCSVFKAENEEAIDFIKQKFHLELIKMELLKGYTNKADTMFAALLKKPL